VPYPQRNQQNKIVMTTCALFSQQPTGNILGPLRRRYRRQCSFVDQNNYEDKDIDYIIIFVGRLCERQPGRSFSVYLVTNLTKAARRTFSSRHKMGHNFVHCKGDRSTSLYVYTYLGSFTRDYDRLKSPYQYFSFDTHPKEVKSLQVSLG
jgi:hypothetical protein